MKECEGNYESALHSDCAVCDEEYCNARRKDIPKLILIAGICWNLAIGFVIVSALYHFAKWIYLITK